jgi:hypothetical protein
MKRLFFLIFSASILLSCASTREVQTSGSELRKERKFAREAMVRNAVESKRFIVRFDRIYLSYGGMVDLVPRENFIIVDGEKAVISTAYLGRQFGFRPIAGINMAGRAMQYDLRENDNKGNYEIDLKVDNRSDSFDVYLAVGADGNCTVSLSNVRLSNVSYSGSIVPIKDKEQQAPPERKDWI